jgi:hypothetical protein
VIERAGNQTDEGLTHAVATEVAHHRSQVTGSHLPLLPGHPYIIIPFV